MNNSRKHEHYRLENSSSYYACEYEELIISYIIYYNLTFITYFFLSLSYTTFKKKLLVTLIIPTIICFMITMRDVTTALIVTVIFKMQFTMTMFKSYFCCILNSIFLFIYCLHLKRFRVYLITTLIVNISLTGIYFGMEYYVIRIRDYYFAAVIIYLSTLVQYILMEIIFYYLTNKYNVRTAKQQVD